ncbi:MFS transporter [Saccharospirillum salsuginis]|uniref:Major facilitator superfamily (MFS) profile domain-containing protein n=1 Tax=Saccharospirillum salsuginis TaxID=418750 RepID=A0A918K9I9_9GAMM|nr:MFS transporter [Saccharospirillum salsuginis]GGX55008.1 hypothetical protein GCM10007392_23210 [Saccharospirillum salsuginis]
MLHDSFVISLNTFSLTPESSFSACAWLPVDGYWSWIAATFVMSLSEAILFPTLNVQIDTMAPRHLRGSYFGANALYGYGFALGPAVGGLLLQTMGATVWYATAGFSVVALLLYMGAVRLLPARAHWVASLEEEAGAEMSAT